MPHVETRVKLAGSTNPLRASRPCYAGLSAQWVGERPRLQAVEIFIRRSRCMKTLSDGDLPMVSVILVCYYFVAPGLFCRSISVMLSLAS